MAIRIVYTSRARKDLANMDPSERRRLERAPGLYSATGRADVRKMVDVPNAFRLRVGKWRALFTYDRLTDEIRVSQIDNRGEAY